MGQAISGESEQQQLSPEELCHLLAHRLAKRTYTDIELYSFRDVFSSLAENSNGINFWSEDTLTRFLELPDALDVGHLIYHASSTTANFPFLGNTIGGPGILDFEAMVRVVSVFTGRYRKVLRKSGGDPVRLWWRVFSVYDRGGEVKEVEADGGTKGGDDIVVTGSEASTAGDTRLKDSGFVPGHVEETTNDDIFQLADPEDMEDDDDDELALAALDALDAIEVFHHQEKPEIKYIRRIKPEDMVKLAMLLLVLAPLDPQESLSSYVERYSPETLPDLRRSAESVVRSLSSGGKPILWSSFSKSIRKSLPHLFNGLSPLFQHFLFSKRLNMSKRRESKLTPPLLLQKGTIMNHNILSQLSFFIPGENLWRRLRRLYMGSEAGFSMGMFEQKTFKWRAPTILLVSGTRMPTPPESSREKSFTDSLAPKRFPDSVDSDGTVIFGAFIDVPWKISHKECFGDAKTKLFQLFPIHEVFEASKSHTDYVYWNKSAGIGFGAPLPRVKSGDPVLHMNLGAVSLILDESLEFGVFTHSSAGGGAFHNSDLGVSNRRDDWQDRFLIEEIEVWGLGGEEEAKEQARQWAWEEAEALRRRNVQLGSDIEANRALLEMAGIIGRDNRSGGSV